MNSQWALPDADRDLVLTALYELRIAHAEDSDRGARIEALVVKLDGDPNELFLGGS
jgi:hypothetical protein